MANEIKVIARTGQTITVDVFKPDGTEREFGINVTETGQGLLYLGDCATIQAGDIMVAKDSNGNIVGGGEYKQLIAGISASSAVIETGYIGDYKENEKIHFLWHTNVVTSTDGTIKVYRDDGTSEVTVPTGITDTRNFDSQTGVHLCSINLAANPFYVRERDYLVVLSGAVIDGATINAVIATFSIENRYQGLEFIKNG